MSLGAISGALVPLELFTDPSHYFMLAVHLVASLLPLSNNQVLYLWARLLLYVLLKHRDRMVTFLY
jgi:hypothetical protein